MARSIADTAAAAGRAPVMVRKCIIREPVCGGGRNQLLLGPAALVSG